jgi:hypothetical protein
VRSGLAKAEAEQLIKLSKSATTSVAKEAQQRINDAALKYLKVKTGLSSADDLKRLDRLTETMAEKGFAGTPVRPNTKYVDEMLDAIKKMEKKEFVDQAMKIFAELNPAKMNEFTRGRTVKAVIAMANFGVDNPKRAAALLNDWDEGIEGFTKTLQLATKKLKSRELASISDIAERQAKAFDGALDEMMERSPHFKKMSMAERQEIKAKMSGCRIR